jgi:hypothetical protein
MIQSCFIQKRFWFKKTLDYRARTQKPLHRPGDGWLWLDDQQTSLGKLKEESKKIARRCHYTVDDPKAQEIRREKREWRASSKLVDSVS